MKRLLRLRLSLVLAGLTSLPVLTLPFAEQIRAEWRRYLDPRAATLDRIRADLACSVAPMRPLTDRGNGAGWFQYIEGEAPIALEMTVGEDPAFVESVSIETRKSPNVPVVYQLSDEHRHRFLEELADTQGGMTDPADSLRGRMMDDEEGSVPHVEP